MLTRVGDELVRMRNAEGLLARVVMWWVLLAIRAASLYIQFITKSGNL